MQYIFSAFVVLCTMLFFILGILVRVVLSFRTELRADLHDLKTLFFSHEHRDNGQAFIPREVAAKNPGKDKAKGPT